MPVTGQGIPHGHGSASDGSPCEAAPAGAIVEPVIGRSRTHALRAGAALAAAALPLAAPAVVSAARVHRYTPAQKALLASKELWATIDVCSPTDQPNTLGVRGSMPGDGNAHDRMFMSFKLQYLESASKRWIDLSSDAHAMFVAVGAGGSSRQDGSSFEITPVAGKPAFELRGVVDFQWKHAGKVMLSISRATSAGHKSLAGADPAGYSAASCSIG